MQKRAVCLLIDETPSMGLGKPEFAQINQFLKELRVLGDYVALVIGEFNNARLEIQEPMPISCAPELSPRYPEEGYGTKLYSSINKVTEAVQGYHYAAVIVLSDGRDNERNERVKATLGTFPKGWDLFAVGFESDRYALIRELIPQAKKFQNLSDVSQYTISKMGT